MSATYSNGIRTVRFNSEKNDENIDLIAHPKDGTPGVQFAVSDEYGTEDVHTVFYFEDLDSLDNLIDKLDDLRRHF